MRERESLEHMQQDAELEAETIARPGAIRLGSLADIKKALFGELPEVAVREKRCIKEPAGCGKSLLDDSGKPRFNFEDRDQRDAYLREWHISGMCPECWDKMVALAEEEGGEQDQEGEPPWMGDLSAELPEPRE